MLCICNAVYKPSCSKTHRGKLSDLNVHLNGFQATDLVRYKIDWFNKNKDDLLSTSLYEHSTYIHKHLNVWDHYVFFFFFQEMNTFN